MATALTGVNLNEQVYDELRRRVLAREDPPGGKISLHALADELGVSRSPVHHALTRLVSEGLLTVKPRRGYFVTPVTAEALAEGYDVRLALELLAAERSVGRLEQSEVEALASLSDATEEAISHEEWDSANAAFHEYQIDLAGNALLSRFYRDLSVNLMMQVLRGGRVEGHANLVTEHRRIVDAFAIGRARRRRGGHPRAHRHGPPDRARCNRARRRRALTTLD